MIKWMYGFFIFIWQFLLNIDSASNKKKIYFFLTLFPPTGSSGTTDASVTVWVNVAVNMDMIVTPITIHNTAKILAKLPRGDLSPYL